MLALAGAALHFFELSFDFNGLGHFLRKNRNVRVVWLGARAEGYAMSKTTMKLSLGLCASLIGFGVIPSSASLGQSGWFWQNPLPLGNSLYAVSVLDSDTVTAVGADGTIVRTTDGGATWERQTSGTKNFLAGVSFVDANTGTAVGVAGTILRTTDGGATWERLEP